MDVELTKKQYLSIVDDCINTIEYKTKDYGIPWRIYRPPSMTDQLYINANRIRTIQENGKQFINNIGDDIKGEFKGLVNYGVMSIYQFNHRFDTYNPNENVEDVIDDIKIIFDDCFELMIKKNTDYGEAWRNMRVSTLVDLILAKIYRLKHIEDNDYVVESSENPIAIYQDIVNYSIFALILK